MPTVLVLHPGKAAHRQALVRAHRPLLETLGVRLVLAADDPLAADDEVFADALTLPDTEDVGGSWDRLRAWIDARAVDAVMAQSESALLLGSLAARHLGVRGLAPEAALRTACKLHTRLGLRAARVPQPRFALASSAAEARRFAAGSGYPIVLKAVASVRSRLVTLVRDAADVDLAVERLLAGLPRSPDVRRVASFARATGLELGCDPERAFLVEEFATGAPVETDGLVAGAEARSFGVLEQVLTPPPRFFLEGYLLPADRPRAELDAIERVSDAAIVALGLRDTGYSIEMRWDGAEARVIEVNGRLGWDEGFGDLFARRIGVQPLFLALQLALGAPVELAVDHDVHSALAYQSCFEEAVVRAVPGADELAGAARDGTALGLAVGVGQRLHAPPDPRTEPHLAFALASAAGSSRAAYARARAAVDRLRFDLARTMRAAD